MAKTSGVLRSHSFFALPLGGYQTPFAGNSFLPAIEYVKAHKYLKAVYINIFNVSIWILKLPAKGTKAPKVEGIFGLLAKFYVFQDSEIQPYILSKNYRKDGMEMMRHQADKGNRRSYPMPKGKGFPANSRKEDN